MNDGNTPFTTAYKSLSSIIAWRKCDIGKVIPRYRRSNVCVHARARARVPAQTSLSLTRDSREPWRTRDRANLTSATLGPRRRCFKSWPFGSGTRASSHFRYQFCYLSEGILSHVELILISSFSSESRLPSIGDSVTRTRGDAVCVGCVCTICMCTFATRRNWRPDQSSTRSLKIVTYSLCTTAII